MVYIGFFCSQHCIWAAQHTKNNKICANQWHLLQSSTLASQLTLLNLKMEYLFPPHPCMFIPCLLIWGGDSKLGFQFVVKLVTPHRRAAPHHTTTTPPTSTSTTITATELRRNLKKWISEIFPKHTVGFILTDGFLKWTRKAFGNASKNLNVYNVQQY